MSGHREKPFEYLRRRATGEPFGVDIVRNWYLARAFVLQRLKDIAFRPDSGEHLHVVLDGDSPRMLFVARQVALSAHYINYQEDADEADRHRTVITLVSRRADITEVLEEEEYLCHLPKYCKVVDRDGAVAHADSFLDIEIHIVDVWQGAAGEYVLVISSKEVDEFFDRAKDDTDVLSIDTSKAVYASRIYWLGELIDNLPAEDIHCARRYALALDVFQHEKLGQKPGPLIDEGSWQNLSTVKESLSNIFCSDCFESRALAIRKCAKNGKAKDRALWERYNDALSVSEHARWTTEKLIMGYSPLSPSQRYQDESLFFDSKRKSQYRKNLKKNPSAPAHIDICSYCDLRRINPNDLKYDSFLMLAIPLILRRVG